MTTRQLPSPFADYARGLYAITDEHLLAGRLLTAVEQTLQAGARIIQYRNKHDTFATQVKEASALKALCRRHGALLLINDSGQLCQAVEADGIHIGQGDIALEAARRQLGPNAIIGVSCHNSPELARKAEAGGADYIAMGRFFASRTKPDAPMASISELQSMRAQIRLPIVAIGGITADNGAPLLKAGADILAVIHYLFGSNDVAARTRQLTDLFNATCPPGCAARPEHQA